MGVHAFGPERPAGAIGGSMRRCLSPARCPYARRSVTAETMARLLIEVLPGDPGLALDLVLDVGVATAGG